MALQHFYSRVPARMSFFNRTDSFDTFAFSKELDRDFIQKELAAVYDNKPSKNDASLIRMGKLKPVYCQYFTKSGKFVQSCMTHLPLDYTGERSAFFTHTLVMNEEEEKALLFDPDNLAFNPQMFSNDIGAFDLTNEKAKPDTEYPELEYKPVKMSGMDDLLKYDSAMMKRLIFAMLNLSCGKGKNIFVSMPYEMDTFSIDSLNFINTLLQIFPYHLRKAFSFVTYTDDGTRYNGFNLRFVPEGVPEIPLNKGMTLHFGSKIAIGLSDEMVINNNQIVEFFYNLIKNDSLRRKFLDFIDGAVKNDPSLVKASLKNMTELVFLFQVCSGLYSEFTVIPDDKRLYEFICAYDKRRVALSDEYRALALQCLKRYSDTHTMIPREVFTKVNHMYKTEPAESKKVVMQVVLQLIHTDLMREKLFNFIKLYYEFEDSDMRAEISDSLCRVFYGGFLQAQIINFFEENFHNESTETKNNVVDKLLLSIRTPSVKDKILAFFDNGYDALTSEQKEKLYATFFEMLPEADQLAVDFISLVDKHISEESDEFKSGITDKIYNLLIKDEQSENHPLLDAMLNTTGFCITSVAVKILTSGDSSFFGIFCKKLKSVEDMGKKLAIIKGIWELNPDIPKDSADAWAQIFVDVQSETPTAFKLFDLIECDKTLSPMLSENESKRLFAQKILDGYIRPSFCRILPKILVSRIKTEVFNSVVAYTRDKEYILSSPEYQPIENYCKFIDSAKNKNLCGMIETAWSFKDEQMRLGVSEYIKSNVMLSKDCQTEEYETVRMLTKLLLSYFADGELNFFDVYSDGCTKHTEKLFADNPNIKREEAESQGAKETVGKLLEIAERFFVTDAFEGCKEKVFEPNGSLSISLSAFNSKVKHGDKIIEELLAGKDFDSGFKNKVIETMAAIKKASGGLFKKLFKK